jgi:hypothetical protein
MRSISRAAALAAAGGCTVLLFGCARSTPERPAAARDSAAAFAVFRDTAMYRRYCEVPAGRPVDLKQPCLLLDQSRPAPRRLAPPRP